MMTQSVMTQAAHLFGNIAGNPISKEKQSGLGFDLILGSSIKSDVRPQTQQSERGSNRLQPKESKTDGQNVKDPAKLFSKENGKQEGLSTTKAPTVADTDKSKEASVLPVNSKAETNSTWDEQLAAQIAGMLQSIQNMVTDILNLTDTELTQLLEEQGIQLIDLLDVNNLQQFILVSNNKTDIFDALTDENLSGMMKQIMESMKEITTELEAEFSVEQIKAILSKLEEGNETAPDEKVFTFGKEATQQDDEAVMINRNTKDLTVKDSKEQTNLSPQSEEGKSFVTKAENAQDLGSSDNNSGAKQKTADQYDVFINNLVKASGDIQVEDAGHMMQVTQLREIANQIVEQVKIIIKPEQTSMEMQLNPEHLGRVNLAVNSKNGVMTAQFIVQSEMAKEAIESQIHILKETFSQQGLKVEAVDVSVANFAFEQSSQANSNDQQPQQKRSGRTISLEDAVNTKDGIEEEENTAYLSETTGSNIDYTA